MSQIQSAQISGIDEFHHITETFLKADTILAPASLGLVFGSLHIPSQLAKKAAELYHQGFFPKLLATGGVKIQGNKDVESVFMAKELQRLGVPEEDILLETKSKNTQENVEFSKKIVAGNISSLISIGNVKAGRRFLMTLKKHWPEVFAMHQSINAFDRPIDQWHLSSPFRKAVLEEHGKIDPYIAKGYIESVNIKAINKQAA